MYGGYGYRSLGPHSSPYAQNPGWASMRGRNDTPEYGPQSRRRSQSRRSQSRERAVRAPVVRSKTPTARPSEPRGWQTGLQSRPRVRGGNQPPSRYMRPASRGRPETRAAGAAAPRRRAKSQPRPVSTDDAFAAAEAEIQTALRAALRVMMAQNAATLRELEAEEAEKKALTRVPALDVTHDGSKDWVNAGSEESDDDEEEDDARLANRARNRVHQKQGGAAHATLDSASDTDTPDDEAAPCVFDAGAFNLPHPRKAATGGEDAYFTSADGHALGVADGVSSWSKVKGSDVALFTNLLMDQACVCARHRLPDGRVKSPVRILLETVLRMRKDVLGSATVCVMTIEGNHLFTANLGDSSYRVLRANAEGDYSIVHVGQTYQHSFNCPATLGAGSPDTPYDALTARHRVHPGDLVVCASDGLFDNLFDKEIEVVVNNDADAAPHTLARTLAEFAHEKAKGSVPTPFALEAAKHGRTLRGGKLDDTCVVVARVTADPTPGHAPVIEEHVPDVIDLSIDAYEGIFPLPRRDRSLSASREEQRGVSPGLDLLPASRGALNRSYEVSRASRSVSPNRSFDEDVFLQPQPYGARAHSPHYPPGASPQRMPYGSRSYGGMGGLRPMYPGGYRSIGY